MSNTSYSAASTKTQIYNLKYITIYQNIQNSITVFLGWMLQIYNNFFGREVWGSLEPISVLAGSCVQSQDRRRGAKLMGVQVKSLETSSSLRSKGRHLKMLVLGGIHENPSIWLMIQILIPNDLRGGFLQITLNSGIRSKSDLLTGRSCSESHDSSCWCVGLRSPDPTRKELSWTSERKVVVFQPERFLDISFCN